jgi:hypothetical protein
LTAVARQEVTERQAGLQGRGRPFVTPGRACRRQRVAGAERGLPKAISSGLGGAVGKLHHGAGGYLV